MAGRISSRSWIVSGLLAAALLVVSALAWRAWDEARARRSLADRALAEVARFGAWEYAGMARRALAQHVVDHSLQRLEAVAAGANPAAFDPGGPLDGAAAGLHDGEVRAWFRLDRETRELRAVTGSETGQERVAGSAAPLPSLVAAWIRDTLSGALTARTDSRWGFGMEIVGGDDGHAIVWRPFPKEAGPPTAAYGFVIDVDVVRAMLARAFEETVLLPPSLLGSGDNSALLRVMVEGPEGQPLHVAGDVEESPWTVRDTLGLAFAGLEVTAALDPAAAAASPLAAGGGSPLPLLVALLALTVGLAAGALHLLQREIELARLRADFVSGVTHDLRTPLAQIRLWAETLLLGRERGDGERRRGLMVIAREAERLGHQIESVLLFAHAGRRGAALDRELVDLGELAESTVAGFRPLADSRRVRIELALEPGIVAEADRNALRQVLLDLLDNALKYGPPGQTLTVGAAGSNGRARLWVADQGPGVPERERRRVWQPYARLARDRGGPTGGSGIGLAVVREVVELHGGVVRVCEAQGGGARFEIELPRAAREGAH